nr:diguanylate cyclase [Lachnospiraceae bacterium]
NYARIYVKHGKMAADELVKKVVKAIEWAFGKNAIIARSKRCGFFVCDKGITFEEMKNKALACANEIKEIKEAAGCAVKPKAAFAIAMGSEASGMHEVGKLLNERISATINAGDEKHIDAEEMETLPDSFRDMPLPYVIVRPIFDKNNEIITDLRYVFANHKYCEMSGRRSEELLGKAYLKLFPKTDRNWVRYATNAVNGENVRGRAFGGGLNHWVGFIAAPSSIAGCCQVVFWPIDDEVKERNLLTKGHATDNAVIRVARKLSSGEKTGDVLLESLAEIGRATRSDRVYILNIKGVAIYEWCAEGVMTGVRFNENNSWNIDYFRGDMKPAESIVVSNLADVKHSGAPNAESAYEFLRAEGIQRYILVPLFEKNRLMGFLGVDNYKENELIDIKELMEEVSYFISTKINEARLINELNKMSTQDSLTGLLNRRGLRQEIDAYIKDNPEAAYTFFTTDIDNFKLINDMYGHPIGDDVLRVFAEELSKSFGDFSVIARTGGDEFCALIRNKSGEDVRKLIHDFVNKEHFYFAGGEEYKYTISLGYSEYPEQTRNMFVLFEQADAALYNVKTRTKNGFSRYSSEMRMQSRTQLAFNLKNVGENLPGALLVYQATDEERILYANDELVRMFECEDMDDLLNFTKSSFKGMVHPEDLETVEKEIWKQIRDEKNVDGNDYVDYRIITKNGNTKNVIDNGRLVENEFYGDVFYVLIIDKDQRNKK